MGQIEDVVAAAQAGASGEPGPNAIKEKLNFGATWQLLANYSAECVLFIVNTLCREVHLGLRVTIRFSADTVFAVFSAVYVFFLRSRLFLLPAPPVAISPASIRRPREKQACRTDLKKNALFKASAGKRGGFLRVIGRTAHFQPRGTGCRLSS